MTKKILSFIFLLFCLVLFPAEDVQEYVRRLEKLVPASVARTVDVDIRCFFPTVAEHLAWVRQCSEACRTGEPLALPLEVREGLKMNTLASFLEKASLDCPLYTTMGNFSSELSPKLSGQLLYYLQEILAPRLANAIADGRTEEAIKLLKRLLEIYPPESRYAFFAAETLSGIFPYLGRESKNPNSVKVFVERALELSELRTLLVVDPLNATAIIALLKLTNYWIQNKHFPLAVNVGNNLSSVEITGVRVKEKNSVT